ncbi:hypothetical protein JAAARDRAFT_47592 [Jaapia argillacea MUCL 33604]|uniref:Dynamitin domain-containing protein n=1 Tax=Jaapia argillacea MUCL 33604 TaxID=933084 RepID=A0A067Q2L4_9AGAM|nr:hypothetical protein JAAARDRAFT_47592 [Jaapia argillacea MUCL 33604]
MSANKYANLPDIDTAQDVYETEDVFPSTATKGDDSDDDLPSRPPPRVKNGDPNQELDSSNLIAAEEASKRFKKAERKRAQRKIEYTYPPSPTSPSSPSHPNSNRPLTYRDRLRLLQSELASLETELSDPSNPLLHKEREEDNVDPGELIRGLVDVRGRLDKINKRKEGRGRLVEVVLGEERDDAAGDEGEGDGQGGKEEDGGAKADGKAKKEVGEVKSIAEMDRRVGELEELIGSASTSLDEASPIPPPLLPMLTRLNSQLTLLTQPRHIDSISRRLKLLLSDLDRVSASSNANAQSSKGRHPSNHPATSPTASTSSPPTTTAASPLIDQLAPLLTRLAPTLPHIPHILTRLRTLSALHTSASEFQNTLEDLEEDQKKVREALEELGKAVGTVEKSLDENRGLVKGNVTGLEERVDGLLQRLEELKV